jgi:polysaccharide export outer membrane protein
MEGVMKGKGSGTRLLLILATSVCWGQRSSAQDVYEIGPADVLKIVVLGQDQMSGEFTVDRLGMIRFPFLGNVKAAELSPRDLERKLATLLADGYLKRPQVAVSVKESNSQRVYVTGEVKKPGAYGLRAERSLRALLAEIGELTADAGHEVVVIRPPKFVEPPTPSPTPTLSPGGEREVQEGSVPAQDGEAEPAVEPTPTPAPTPTPDPSLPGAVPGSEIFRLSLREVRSGNPEKDFNVESGDTVYVPKAAQVYVTGFVARPGAVRFEEGMTVYKAISLAGGVSERGSSKPKVVRIMDGRRKEFKAKPTDLLLPEDTIVVSERFF